MSNQTTPTPNAAANKIAEQLKAKLQKIADYEAFVDDCKNRRPDRPNKRTAIADKKRAWHADYYTDLIAEMKLEVEMLKNSHDKEKVKALKAEHKAMKDVRLQKRQDYIQWNQEVALQAKTEREEAKAAVEKERAAKKAQKEAEAKAAQEAIQKALAEAEAQVATEPVEEQESETQEGE